jgi:hypothetical protein
MTRPMTASEPLTSQDWYRVRRGEDEIAWGRTHRDPELAGVLLSRRSHQKLAFLTAAQQQAIRDELRRLGGSPPGQQGAPVAHGGGRRVLHVAALRIVFRVNPRTRQALVSTIRGGEVLDPENVGPAPT